MIALDLPPPVTPPAIIRARPVITLRLNVNNEDAGASLPADFFAMPKVLRRAVPVEELRGWLPAEYRLLSDGILAPLLFGNIGGLPGVLMAGGVKVAWLFTASGTLTITNNWNKQDNIIQGVGRGGNGHNPLQGDLTPDYYYGGTGGGGAAWAGIYNRDFAAGLALGITVAITSGSTSLSTGDLVAASGGNGGNISGGDGSGGSGGSASSSTGDLKFSGAAGGNINGAQQYQASGANGGAAAGPHGNASSTTADNGQGGSLFNPDGINGPGGGWAPGVKVNVGSGGGGRGASSADNPSNGSPGGRYGGGGGGGGVYLRPIGGPLMGAGAAGTQGCLLAINNASL